MARALACPVCEAAPGERCVNLDGTAASKSHRNRTPVQPCGSYAGYRGHVKRGEEPCEPCRDANRRYMADYRTRRPEVREADISALAARGRATKRLISLHRDEFYALLAEEKRAAS